MKKPISTDRVGAHQLISGLAGVFMGFTILVLLSGSPKVALILGTFSGALATYVLYNGEVYK
jgi:hypothetical protein